MNINFLLRDSQEIYGVFDSLDYTYNNLLQLLCVNYKNYKFASVSTCDIYLITKTFQIIEYNGSMVENVYQLNNEFNIFDMNKKIYSSNKISIVDYITRLQKYVCEEELNTDDLQIFIPVNNETEFNDGNYDQEEKELEAKMKLLENIRKKEIERIEKLKESIVLENELIAKENSDKEYLEKEKERKTEQFNSIKKKFLIDMGVYYTIKNEIRDGIHTENTIPGLFVETYFIIKQMEVENKLNNSDDEMVQDYLFIKSNQTKETIEHNPIFDEPNFEDIKNRTYVFSESGSECDSDSNADSNSDTSISMSPSAIVRINDLHQVYTAECQNTNNTFDSWLLDKGINENTGEHFELEALPDFITKHH